MALIVADRVKQISTTTGTGTISFSSTVNGFQTFANVCSTGDTCYYTIQEESGTDFEIGHGTFNASGQLERTNVLQSSNSDSAVSFGAGNKDVFITYPADKAVFQNYNGTITIPSTIDGRDLQTDGTKLDGIENNATADQTNTEIRTAVEAATDSNVFTDTDHTKLNGIEASATADQTGAEIKSAYEGEADTNAFTDALQTKLNGIATGAEVNVQSDWNSSSGDSEILNKPTITTYNQSLNTSNDVSFDQIALTNPAGAAIQTALSGVGGAGFKSGNADGTGGEAQFTIQNSGAITVIMNTAGTDANMGAELYYIAPKQFFKSAFFGGGDISIGEDGNKEVKLNYNTSKKFETTNTGATIQGELKCTGGLDIDDGSSGHVITTSATNIYTYKPVSFASNTWHAAGDGWGRFYYAANSHTYFSSQATHYFQKLDASNSTSTSILSIDNAGNLISAANITAYGSVSDENKKYDIEKIEKPFDFLDKVKGVKFKYKKDNGKAIGLIAQDVQKTEFEEELVYKYKDLDTDEESLALRYENIIAVLVESTKQQQEQIKILREEVEELKNNKCKCKEC